MCLDNEGVTSWVDQQLQAYQASNSEPASDTVQEPEATHRRVQTESASVGIRLAKLKSFIESCREPTEENGPFLRIPSQRYVQRHMLELLKDAPQDTMTCPWFVRAIQGHSIPYLRADRTGAPLTPDHALLSPCLCHTTAVSNFESILENGLLLSERLIHFSPFALGTTGTNLVQDIRCHSASSSGPPPRC